MTDTQSLNDDPGIQMVACSSSGNHSRSSPHSTDDTFATELPATSCHSVVSNNNVIGVNDITDSMQQVSLNFKNSEGHQLKQQVVVDIERQPYCHPPPYKEPPKLDKYKCLPPYREQKRNKTPTDMLNTENVPGDSLLNNLLQNYRQPPPYREPSEDTAPFHQGVSGPHFQFSDLVKIDQEAQTDAWLYPEASDVFGNTADYYSGGGVANKLCQNVSQSKMQDSYSYSFSAGEPFNGESVLGDFTNYARQASSTNNLFNESQSEVLSFRVFHSPHNSGGEQANLSVLPQAQGVPHRFATTQQSCDSSGYSQVDTNETGRYPGNCSQAEGDPSLLSKLLYSFVSQFQFQFLYYSTLHIHVASILTYDYIKQKSRYSANCNNQRLNLTVG